MSSSSNASKCGVFARYSMVDKTSGQEVGVLIIPEGQAVPDLGQVELRICEPNAGHDEQILVAHVEDSGAANPLVDVTGEKEKSVTRDSQKVSCLNVHEKCQLPRFMKKPPNAEIKESRVIKEVSEDPISMYKKPGQFGWVRKVTVSSTDDHRVTSVTYSRDGHVGVGRRKYRYTSMNGIRKFLKNAQNQVLCMKHFCFEQRVLGLENLEVIEEEHKEYFRKPFKFGWLRKVTIRSRDMRVTVVTHLTPPDSNGNRQSIRYKKDIEKYLNDTGNKDLDVDDFVTHTRVLGLSHEFEIISYSDQPSLTPENDDDSNDVFLTSKDKKHQKEMKSVTTEEDCISVNWHNVSQSSSLVTLVDDSFSSSADGNINNSNLSDSDDSSDAIEPVIAPYSGIPHLPVSPDLSMDTTPSSDADFNILPGETADSAAPPCSKLRETDSFLPMFGKDPIVPPSPLADVSFSLPLSSLPAQSTLPAANPPPSFSSPSHRVSSPTPMATLLMVSTGTGCGRRQQKMMIKSGVKVMKGMKMFGVKFGLDYRKLTFFSGGNKLTGEELAGELDGAKIVVEELG